MGTATKTASKDITKDTGKVLAMLSYVEDDSDIAIGRTPEGGNMDINEFDPLPTNEVYMTEEDAQDALEGEGAVEESYVTETDDNDVELATPAPFESPIEAFPVFKTALRHFKSKERKPRVVRIDTDSSYEGFVGEQAIKELDRRLTELEGKFHDHEGDPDAHGVERIRSKRAAKSDVLGAAAVVKKIAAATTVADAAKVLPMVPVDVPPFAEGKVRCWKDGDQVVCSLRFLAADGAARVATMAAKPKVDIESVVGWASRSGMHPVTLLGVMGDLADVACGKRLVKDVAGAALAAHRRADVCGMLSVEVDADEEQDEPILLQVPGDEGGAPRAAMMHLQQQCEAGDKQACREMKKLEAVARTRGGHEIVGNLIADARARLAAGRAAKKGSGIGRWFSGLIEKYHAAVGVTR